MKNKKNNKTPTDMWFENYLKQEGISFKYEPYGNSSGKSPDYLFEKAGKKILIENKEIEKTPFDNATTGVQMLDPTLYFNLLRNRIDKASRQLKPYKDDVDFCVVILGKVSGFPIFFRDLFWAMYGNPIIRVQINTNTNKVREKPYLDLTMTGSMRKNHPTTKQFRAVHDYVSAVGLIKAFKGLAYYEEQVMSPVMAEYYEKNKDKEELVGGAFALYSKEWKKAQKNIPAQYQDPNKVYYRLELMANPLSKKVISKEIFTGQWDIVQFPKVVNK